MGGQPLLTSCFRIIPPRVLKDDTENLVRSITTRTCTLVDLAEKAWPLLQDKKKTAVQRITQISNVIQQAPGCGETWAKMLTVCIDLAYPKEQFLEKQCDVGTGAAPPLRAMLPNGGTGDTAKDLKDLLKSVNSCKSVHAKNFWATLKNAETIIRSNFKALPLVCAQASTKSNAMTACTLQVQLCEYRQFRHSLARLKYGLPDDEKMRGEVEHTSKACFFEDHIEHYPNKPYVQFDFHKGDSAVEHFQVPLKVV